MSNSYIIRPIYNLQEDWVKKITKVNCSKQFWTSHGSFVNAQNGHEIELWKWSPRGTPEGKQCIIFCSLNLSHMVNII